MKTEIVDINSVKQDGENARLHDDTQLEYIAASLRRFGLQKPIVVGTDGVIIAGNGTHLAARDILGWKEIAIVRSDLSLKEARAYGIADNSIASKSSWNLSTLSKHLGDLNEWNPLQDWQSIGFEDKIVETIESTTTEEESTNALDEMLNGIDKQEKVDKVLMGKPLKLTEEQRGLIDTAIARIRFDERDGTMSEGRCIELVVADWLSSTTVNRDSFS